MKKLITLSSIITMLSFSCSAIASAQAPAKAATTATADTPSDDVLNETGVTNTAAARTPTAQNMNIHQSLKHKFIEGSVDSMSLIALVLVLSSTFCIECITYLSLSEVDVKRFIGKLDDMIVAGEIGQAEALSRDARRPIASICYQGLLRVDDSTENIECSVTSYGSVQSANLEKDRLWITLFIAMVPSLDFLGTVIDMVMVFDQIQGADDTSPTIVASGMKVALITAISGIIVALVLQIFCDYIPSEIDHITAQMGGSAITLLGVIMRYRPERIQNL